MLFLAFIFSACGEDINEGMLNPFGPEGGLIEIEPNNTPELAQILEPAVGEELVLSGSFFGVGLTSGELDFYILRTPAGSGPLTATVTLSWKVEGDFNVTLYGEGVSNFDGFTTNNPEVITQEVEPEKDYTLLLIATTGEPGDYTLTILVTGS